MTAPIGTTIVRHNAKINRAIVALVALGVLACVALAGAGLYYQVRSNAKLLGIARTNRDNGVQIKHAVDVLNGVTGPDAQARQAQVLGGAITDIRRSIDCVALFAIGQRPPACVDVDARLDALLAGGDPFAPTKGTP